MWCDVYWLSKGIRSTCYATMSTNLHTRKYTHIFTRAYRRKLKRACPYIHTYIHTYIGHALWKKAPKWVKISIFDGVAENRDIHQNGCQASAQGPVWGGFGGVIASPLQPLVGQLFQNRIIFSPKTEFQPLILFSNRDFLKIRVPCVKYLKFPPLCQKS